MRRLRSRLRGRGCRNGGEYLELLEQDPGEWELLYKALIINVSSFFRNGETFWFLRDRVLPEIFARKVARKSRVVLVSAGCAEGEEPYSLAMVVERFFAAEAAQVETRIVGIDIDPEALARAEEGLYPADRLAELPGEFRTRFFRREGRQYRLGEEVRRRVSFVRRDLREDLGLSEVDLIMSRNVLIYFRREYQGRMLRSWWEALGEGGYLVLGKTETMSNELRPFFRVIDVLEHVYQKAGVEPCGWR